MFLTEQNRTEQNRRFFSVFLAIVFIFTIVQCKKDEKNEILKDPVVQLAILGNQVCANNVILPSGGSITHSNLNNSSSYEERRLYYANNTIYLYTPTKISKVTETGSVTDFVGSGVASSVDGTGASASFFKISSLASDSEGNLYAADRNYFRKITQAGVVTTDIGLSTLEGYLLHIASDHLGNLYWASSDLIRSSGTVIKKGSFPALTMTNLKTIQEKIYDLFRVDSNGNLYFYSGKIKKLDTSLQLSEIDLPFVSTQQTMLRLDDKGNIYYRQDGLVQYNQTTKKAQILINDRSVSNSVCSSLGYFSSDIIVKSSNEILGVARFGQNSIPVIYNYKN